MCTIISLLALLEEYYMARFGFDHISFMLLDELISNDPPNQENPHKSFFVQIGSARPMRGQNYRTPILRIQPTLGGLETSVEE